jgi:hypothetical protein
MSLDTWVMIGGWDFLDRFEIGPFLDMMEEAGASHLAFAGMLPLLPNPRHYRESRVKGVCPPAEIMAREGAVHALFEAARSRGIGLYLYGANPHCAHQHAAYNQLPAKRILRPEPATVTSYWQACANGAEFLPYYLGRIADAHGSFPEIEGILNDGPEFGYEIASGFMNDNLSVFGCFGPCCEAKAAELGHGFEDLRRAASALWEWLHALDAEAIELLVEHEGTPAEALAEAAGEVLIEDWLRFKTDSIACYIEDLCAGVKQVDPFLAVGVGSRLPAFTPLTGYDLTRLAVHADFLLPKIYLWMGGVDGLYGTVYRWAGALKSWNTELSESLIFRFVYRLFGFALPGTDSLAEMSRHIEPRFRDSTGLTYLGAPFAEAFFTDVVADQVRLMLAQAGTDKIRPWLDTDHGGRALTPHELDLTLEAAAAEGLKSYLYYCPIDGGSWEVAVKHGTK